MSPEDAPLMGWVLVIVGIALAFIVYFIYINFFAEKKVNDGESEDDAAHELKDDYFDSQHTVDEVKQVSSSENGDEEPETGETSGSSSNGKQEKPVVSMQSQKSLSVVPADQELIPIATILREADTGRMVVRINDEDFSSPAAIKDSGNWSRVQGLQSDFANWLNESQDSLSHDALSASDSVAKQGNADDEGMIPQINQIIELKIRELDNDQQSVRLVEGLEGSLKVLVGVESFPFDDVPYEEVRKLIQESVAEWEAKQ